MRAMTLTLLVGASAWLAGCAAHPDPIIDMKGVDEEEFATDWAECEAYSEEVSVAKGTAKGAGLGAVIGAAAGAIGGDSGDVAEGAAYGGLYGGTGSGLDAKRDKEYVFKRCMAGRGYNVLN
jgi:hypothetical protein